LIEDLHDRVRIRTANHATQTARFTQSVRVFDEIKIQTICRSDILCPNRNIRYIPAALDPTPRAETKQDAVQASLLKNHPIGSKLPCRAGKSS
jgi:hypothetical protein